MEQSFAQSPGEKRNNEEFTPQEVTLQQQQSFASQVMIKLYYCMLVNVTIVSEGALVLIRGKVGTEAWPGCACFL